jgi:DNA-binding transcriptional LysR family regulator
LFDIRTVDYFLTAVSTGSLRAAAQALGVTQPALTKAIRRLEDSFGAPLFDRQARGVTPTVYGVALLRHAKDMKAALDAAREEVEALRSGNAGLVKVGAGPSWQSTILPESIAELRLGRPGVRVHVVGGNDNQLKEQLKSGALDFVLAAVPETPRLAPELVWQSLMADQYCVIADIHHPLRRQALVTTEDLLAYPWILPAATSYMVGRLHQVFRMAGLPPPQPAIETDVVPLKLELMRGSTYLSYHAETHLAGMATGHIMPIEAPGTRAVRDAGLINRRKVDPSPAASALIAILRRRCDELRRSDQEIRLAGAAG